MIFAYKKNSFLKYEAKKLIFSKLKNKHWTHQETELLKSLIEKVTPNQHRIKTTNGTISPEPCSKTQIKRYLEQVNTAEKDGSTTWIHPRRGTYQINIEEIGL